MWSGGAPGAVVAISRGWGSEHKYTACILYSIVILVQMYTVCILYSIVILVQMYTACILYSIVILVQMYSCTLSVYHTASECTHIYIQSYNGPRHTFQPFCFVILQKMWVCTTLRVQWCFVSKKVFEFPKKIKKSSNKETKAMWNLVSSWFIDGQTHFQSSYNVIECIETQNREFLCMFPLFRTLCKYHGFLSLCSAHLGHWVSHMLFVTSGV